jgi:hypothetical protein
MTNIAICPECRNDFRVKFRLIKNHKPSVGIGSNISDRIDSIINFNVEALEAPLVDCPYCGYEFINHDYRYFGFLRPIQIKYSLLVVFLILIIAPVVIILLTFFLVIYNLKTPL